MVLKDLCKKGKKFFYRTQTFALNYNYELIWSTCVLIIIKESVEILHNLNNIKSVPILTHRLDVLSMVIQFHGKKLDTDIYSQQSDHGFSRHISLQSKISHLWKTKSRDENGGAFFVSLSVPPL